MPISSKTAGVSDWVLIRDEGGEMKNEYERCELLFILFIPHISSFIPKDTQSLPLSVLTRFSVL